MYILCFAGNFPGFFASFFQKHGLRSCKLQFIVLLENAVGNAVLSAAKEFWGSMPQNSYDFHDLPYKYMPLRGRNAEDSVPYGMLEKLQFAKTLHNIFLFFLFSKANQCLP